jgi:Ca-activated chloride channel family protein
MKFMVPMFVVVFLSLLFVPGATALNDENQDDKTLSPYFAVEGGDASIDRFPLGKTRVEVSISGVIAHVVVTQSYVNKGTRPINAKYVFPASTRAAVHGMKMTIGEHIIQAKIREKEQAKKEFEKAKEEGKSASLLEQERPNVFTMNISNILPGDVIDIELRYSELLVPTNGTYEFVYPTVVGPRYSETPLNTATDHDKWVQNPYLHEGTESPSQFDISLKISTGIPLEELTCSSHETNTVWDGKEAATVTLAPSPKATGNRDFILKYRLMGKQVQSGLMLYQGEDENFFLLLAQPPEKIRAESLPPREYIFVVDVSGSMNGFPLNVSKGLLKSLVGGLKPTDTFNVILFAGTSDIMAERSLPATPENIRRAIAVIDDQRGSGGTRLYPALERALSLPHPESVSRSIVVVTDGFIDSEKAIFSLVQKSLNNANVFSFGIGSSVNRFLIEGLAKAGQGEPFIVTKESEAESVGKAFLDYIASPVLTNVSVDYDGFEAYAVEPPFMPDLMAQRPLQVFGKWRGNASGTITIKGTHGEGEYKKSFPLSEIQARPEHRSLRYLWARAKVSALSDFNFTVLDKEAVREVTSLGLTYELLTEYTSFVAVHEMVRNPGNNRTDVVQPLPLPKGVSDLAVGGGPDSTYSCNLSTSQATKKVPEPEVSVVLLILALFLLGAGIHRFRQDPATE